MINLHQIELFNSLTNSYFYSLSVLQDCSILRPQWRHCYHVPHATPQKWHEVIAGDCGRNNEATIRLQMNPTRLACRLRDSKSAESSVLGANWGFTCQFWDLSLQRWTRKQPRKKVTDVDEARRKWVIKALRHEPRRTGRAPAPLYMRYRDQSTKRGNPSQAYTYQWCSGTFTMFRIYAIIVFCYGRNCISVL